MSQFTNAFDNRPGRKRNKKTEDFLTRLRKSHEHTYYKLNPLQTFIPREEDTDKDNKKLRFQTEDSQDDSYHLSHNPSPNRGPMWKNLMTKINDKNKNLVLKPKNDFTIDESQSKSVPETSRSIDRSKDQEKAFA